MYFRLSINRFLDIHNSFLDIQKWIYGYPIIHFWLSKKHAEFWTSIIRFLDIHNSFLGYPNINVVKDILKYIFGYPKNILNLGYP